MSFSTVVESELIIILGCGDIRELYGRCDVALDIYKKLPRATILITGTPKEVVVVKNYVSKESISSEDIVIEIESTNTIENIVNSFKIIRNPYSALYYTPSKNGNPQQFKKYHMVSGEYHLERIKLIVDTLKLGGKIPMEYHGSDVYNSSRIGNEMKIKSNISRYIQLIKSYAYKL